MCLNLWLLALKSRNAQSLTALAIALFSKMLMILCIHIAIVACIDREPNVLVA